MHSICVARLLLGPLLAHPSRRWLVGTNSVGFTTP
jgi:hypothetical protein